MKSCKCCVARTGLRCKNSAKHDDLCGVHKSSCHRTTPCDDEMSGVSMPPQRAKEGVDEAHREIEIKSRTRAEVSKTTKQETRDSQGRESEYRRLRRPGFTSPWIVDKSYGVPKMDDDLEGWSRHLESIHKKYEKSYLPAGTTLYHGSESPSLIFRRDYSSAADTSGLMVFFGLDPLISLWILTEDKKPSSSWCPAYLYQFKSKRDIPIHYWRETLPHPSEDDRCNMTPCLHPQIVSHCDSVLEVTEELTIPIDLLTEIEFEHCYLVNVESLIKHCKYTIRDYDPTNSIIGLYYPETDPLIKFKKF